MKKFSFKSKVYRAEENKKYYKFLVACYYCKSQNGTLFPSTPPCMAEGTE